MDWIVALILASGLVGALLIVAAIMDHREKKREEQKKRDKIKMAIANGKQVKYGPDKRTFTIEREDGFVEVITLLAAASFLDSGGFLRRRIRHR